MVLFRGSMVFTNQILTSNDTTLLAKVQTVDSNNQYFTYLSHSFDQYYIHMVSLGLVESQNFREVEDPNTKTFYEVVGLLW